MSWVAVGIIGGSLINGVMSNNAASSASSAQQAAADSANATQLQMFNTNTQLQMPWRTAGASSLGYLGYLMGLPGYQGFGQYTSPARLATDPATPWSTLQNFGLDANGLPAPVPPGVMGTNGGYTLASMGGYPTGTGGVPTGTGGQMNPGGGTPAGNGGGGANHGPFIPLNTANNAKRELNGGRWPITAANPNGSYNLESPVPMGSPTGTPTATTGSTGGPMLPATPSGISDAGSTTWPGAPPTGPGTSTNNSGGITSGGNGPGAGAGGIGLPGPLSYLTGGIPTGWTPQGGYGSMMHDFALSDFQTDPGYAFRLGQGVQNLDRSAAARGMLLSGGQLKALDRYNQDYASNEFQNAYNRYNTNRANRFNFLASLAGIGQTSANQLGQYGMNYANQVGQNQIGAGNAQAAGYVGAANGWTNAFNNGLNQWMTYQGMQNGGYGGGGGTATSGAATGLGSMMPVLS